MSRRLKLVGVEHGDRLGYLKNHLSSEDKQGLLGFIEGYRQGLLPLIVPLT